MTRYDPLIDDLRQAAQPDRPAPAGFEPYPDNVRNRAYAVTDADESVIDAPNPSIVW